MSYNPNPKTQLKNLIRIFGKIKIFTYIIRMEKKSDKLAITISKFNRGSLTEQEIQDTLIFFQGKFFNASKMLFVNEHKNKLGENFEHLHITLHIPTSIRRDHLKAELIKKLTFLQHTKDVCIREEYSDGWKEYCSKSPDRNIVYKSGITDDELSQYSNDYLAKVQTRKEIKKVVKTRICPSDLPYVIAEYIQEHEINYDGTQEAYAEIIFRLIKENFDFQIKGKMAETKAKLDIVLNNSGQALTDLLFKEFKD